MRMTCAALVLLASSLHAGTWTVDDDGPADFPGIQQAIDALPAGETLLVQPGDYAAFVLGKRMQIFGVLGAEPPRVFGRSFVTGASTVTIAGLRMDALALEAIAGRARIEDCVFLGLPGGSGLEATGCAEVIVARSTVNGLDTAFGGTVALVVADSTVALLACTVQGGDALPPPCCIVGQDGKDGLQAWSSYVIAVGSSFRGGNGGPPSTFTSIIGNGGHGLHSGGSFVDLRGCQVKAGLPDPSFNGTPAPDLYASGGTVVGDVDGDFVFGAVHIEPGLDLPTLSFDVSVAPGGTTIMSLLCPEAEAGLLVVALDSGIASLAHFEGPLWVLPHFLLLVPVLGPQVRPLDVPANPALSGLGLTFQAVYPGLPGVVDPDDAALSNPEQLVIRY